VDRLRPGWRGGPDGSAVGWRRRASSLLLALTVSLALLAACTGTTPEAGPSGSSTEATPVTQPVTSTSTSPPVITRLVAWTGPVEHLFFHTLMIRPDLAFVHGRAGDGFRDYFVTVGEFRSILDQLYANGWTMVDIHRAVKGDVRVPAGRKPFVLSEDDVNYYDYSRPRGVGWRLVLDDRGVVKVEVRDDHGTRITDDDLVPIVDAFVAAHPDFSADGAKGIIAVTGYEGLFGERVNDTAAPDRADAERRAKAIADRLRATGWIFASHSYGHIDLNKQSMGSLARDTQRWKDAATPIIGPTDVYIYAYGAAPPPGSPKVDFLRDQGFTIQCDIGPTARLVHVDGVDIMSRRHIDGIAFRDGVARLAPLFDVAKVEDVPARSS
jgi:hypothetical protein